MSHPCIFWLFALGRNLKWTIDGCVKWYHQARLMYLYKEIHKQEEQEEQEGDRRKKKMRKKGEKRGKRGEIEKN